MTWDANWTTSGGVGKLTRRAFNQLRSATAERAKAANYTMPVDIQSDVAKYERVTKYKRALLHNVVTNLIPKYADHTDSGGDWTGDETIVTWGEASLLAEIGDPSRESIPDDHIKAAKWNNQTRKILNLLRWVQETTTGTYRHKSATGTDWNDLKTNFASASWVGSQPVYENAFDSSPSYAINNATQHSFNIDKSSQLGSLYFDADVYEYFEPLSGDTLWNINGTLVQKYNKLATFTNTQTFNYKNFTDTEWIDHGEPADDSSADRGGNTKVVYKFDIANGFSYRDW
jgi:hypothetical protein